MFQWNVFFLRILTSTNLLILFSVKDPKHVLTMKTFHQKNDESDGKHSATIILLCKIPNVYQFFQIKNWSSLDAFIKSTNNTLCTALLWKLPDMNMKAPFLSEVLWLRVFVWCQQIPYLVTSWNFDGGNTFLQKKAQKA